MSATQEKQHSEGFHAVAEIFPLMTGEPYRELVADIAANGLREPIWLYQGKIIDGRSRWRACTDAAVEPKYREYEGKPEDLVKFVLSMNLHRRHLTESQRAMVAAKLSNRPPCIRKGHKARDAGGIQPASDPTSDEAAEMLSVNRSTIIAAKKVRRDGAKEIIDAVEGGNLSVHAAVKIVEHPKDEQERAMERHKLLKNKRTIRADKPTAREGTGAMPDTLRITIDTKEPEAAAAAVAATLETEFLERFVDELQGILARAKAAQARGMGPVRKG
jgi:ParB-like chromosome segregation protein Spo0J